MIDSIDYYRQFLYIVTNEQYDIAMKYQEIRKMRYNIRYTMIECITKGNLKEVKNLIEATNYISINCRDFIRNHEKVGDYIAEKSICKFEI